MTVQEIVPMVNQLKRDEKFWLAQYLLAELAQEENIPLSEPETILSTDKTYPIWTPYNSFGIADQLWQLLQEEPSQSQ